MHVNLSDEKNQQIERRQKQLFALGLAKKAYGFVFKEYYVAHYSIVEMNPIEWDRYIESITKHVTEIKAQILAPLTDSEKLEGFARQLREMAGPEMRSHNGLETVKVVLTTLSDLAEFVEDQARAMKNG